MLSERAYNQLKSLAEKVSQREGCHLYDIEFLGSGKSRTLRIFIDAPEKGVDIDQCANVSRAMSLLLDVEDIIPGGNYQLEVSSPGLERPLRWPWHFEAVLNKEVKVKTTEPVKDVNHDKASPVKQVIGELVAVDDKGVRIKAREKEWVVHFDQIKKANLIFSFENKKQKKK